MLFLRFILQIKACKGTLFKMSLCFDWILFQEIEVTLVIFGIELLNTPFYQRRVATCSFESQFMCFYWCKKICRKTKNSDTIANLT